MPHTGGLRTGDRGDRAVAALVVLAALLAWLSPVLFTVRASARSPVGPVPATTPIATVVPPVEQTVVSQSEVVSPETSRAEGSTGPAEVIGVAAGGSDSPFTGLRGALIGAGFGVGVVALIAAVFAGARSMAGRASR